MKLKSPEVLAQELEALEKEVMANPAARRAAFENKLRNKIAETIFGRHVPSAKRLEDLGLKKSQAKRILGLEVGPLYLSTIVMVADFFWYDLEISFKKKQ